MWGLIEFLLILCYMWDQVNGGRYCLFAAVFACMYYWVLFVLVVIFSSAFCAFPFFVDEIYTVGALVGFSSMMCLPRYIISPDLSILPGPVCTPCSVFRCEVHVAQGVFVVAVWREMFFDISHVDRCGAMVSLLSIVVCMAL